MEIYQFTGCSIFSASFDQCSAWIMIHPVLFVMCIFFFRKYHRGHRVRQVGALWALTFVEVDEQGRTTYLDIVFLDRSKRSVKEIFPEIEKRFDAGATMTTDLWKAYPRVAEDCGLRHLTVNHSKEFVAEDGTHTNNVEGNICKCLYLSIYLSLHRILLFIS